MQAKQIKLQNRIREHIELYNKVHIAQERLTVAKLAQVVGISEDYVRKIISGSRSCSQEVQFAIAHALGCKVDEIFFAVPAYKTYEKLS